jgi:hypothetical protein
MKTKLIPIMLALLLLPLLGQATHLYSGHISYDTDPQNPRTFHFVLTLFTYSASPAEDPFINISMGDGVTLRVDRKSVTKFGIHYDKELFTWTYTFPAAGTYTVAWVAENRNGGIINLAAPSDMLSFHVITELKVNPLAQNLHGAKLAGSPIVEAFTGEPWTHNLLAYDADGDYLAYELVPPKHRYPTGTTGNAPGYWIPDGLTVNEFGELHWENPGAKGQYVLVLRVTEMRNGRVLGAMEVEFTFFVRDRSDQPKLSLINKERLTVNDDGSIQVWPGQPVKLEFYMQKSPGSDLPLMAKEFGELDTLRLAETSLAFRDTAEGFAVTYTFTPSPALERPEPYLIGVRGNVIEKLSSGQVEWGKVGNVWAFAYLYVGGPRRSLSAGDRFPICKPKLYPNPIADRFTLVAPQLPSLYLQLLDLNGRVVAGNTLEPGQNTIPRPASLAKGLYLYTLTSRQKPLSSGKLVLQ